MRLSLKKILHVITGLGSGGAEANLFKICSSDKSNLHIVISLTDSGKYGELLEDIGVKLICLGAKRGRFSIKSCYDLFLSMRREAPDLVQCWMYHSDLLGGVLARLAGVKNVFWNIRHSNLTAEHNSIKTRFVAKLCAFLSHQIPTSIICCAEEAKRVHIELGYCSKKMTVIHNGYELGKFSFSARRALNESVREELGISIDTIVIGMVARYNPQKNHVGLAQAIASLPKLNLTVVLVGSGVDESNKNLQESCEKLGVRSKFIFLGERPDISRLMSMFDLHVLSSTSGEGFPNVVAEAMSVGTPCIATDVGDSSIIVGNLGWIVDKNCIDDLSKSISEAVFEMQNRREIWRSRQRNSANSVKARFSIEAMIENYNAVWSCRSC